jgi:NADH-quinone oxidoreductase subunit H
MQIESSFISSVYSFFYNLTAYSLGSFWANVASIIAAFVVFAVLLGFLVAVFSYLFGWLERKLIARVHSRHGPTYVGKFGLLQNMADIVKLISKGSFIPKKADKVLFRIALPLLYALFVMILAFIPITGSFVGIDATLGLIIVFLILSFAPLLLFIQGWSSGNKFSSISAQRSVVLMVSYEIPLLLVIAAIAMLSNSFSISSIVASQSSMWYIVLMPLGFIVFFIVMLAELERPPFDLREADNELVAGWLTDMGPPYYALALFLDYTRMFVGTLLISLLFLGGWLGPSFLPASLWIMIKVVLLCVLIVVIRVAMMRMRIDRVLRVGWLYLVPLAVVNLLITFILFVG